MAKKSNDARQDISWKKRPSEIRNYQRTLYTTLDNNDYLRIDYNAKDKLVRLYVEVNEEGGSPYYSIIKDGAITTEKNVESGRTGSAGDKFTARAEFFSTIPNKEVIRLINKNYGIDFPGSKSSGAAVTERKKRFDEIRSRYFKSDDASAGERRADSGAARSGIRFIDIFDLVIGCSLSGAVFYFLHFDYIALGIAASFYGIIIGLVDLIFRSRPPVVFKMLLFIIGGALSYIYGYFAPG